jgi:hypothetical protein
VTQAQHPDLTPLLLLLLRRRRQHCDVQLHPRLFAALPLRCSQLYSSLHLPAHLLLLLLVTAATLLDCRSCCHLD